MRTIKAPDGWEGRREWVDGEWEWRVAYRREGGTRWKRGWTIGGAHLIDEELDRRAEKEIARAIRREEGLAAD